MIDLSITLLPVIAQVESDQIAKLLEIVNLAKLSQAAFIIFLAWIINKFFSSAFDRFGEGNARLRLLMKKIASFTRLGIFGIAAVLVVQTMFEGQDDALLGIGATLGIGIGFALKDTLSSLMSGVLILFDQPFQVGDRVQFGNTYGEVKEIGLRSVRIVTLDDNEVSIPNNKFLTDAVASANSGALDMMVVMRFYISVTEDFELAKRIVYEACITSRYVFLNKPVTMLVRDEVTDVAFSTVIICKAYVIDTRYETAFQTDVTERVKRAFRKNRIQHPYAREYSVRANKWDDQANIVVDPKKEIVD